MKIQPTCFVLSSLVVLAGCATVQQVPIPDTPEPPANKARVIFEREPAVIAAGDTMDIYDNDTKIGELGSGGRFVWDREPGNMQLSIEMNGRAWLSSKPFKTAVCPARSYVFRTTWNGTISQQSDVPITLKTRPSELASSPVSTLKSDASAVIVDTSPGVGIALLIGVNKYDALGELERCQQDVHAIRDTLVKYGGYNPNRVLVLTDNASARESVASYANVTRRIDQACKLAKPGDTLLVYFVGHGITVNNEMFLVPQDGGEPRTCISVDWLRQSMEHSVAAGKMLVLDACHSGKATRGVSGIVPSKFGKQGVLTLSSCADGELSCQEGQRGVFAGYLQAGLQGSADVDNDRQVSSGELFRFIQANMEGWSLRSGKTQRPQISDEAAKLILSKRIPVAEK